jgi:hypothetical protein
MRDFSTIAAPLNDLMKKDVPFYWGVAQEHSFNTLIDKVTNAPLLQLPDFGKTFELECDASGIGIGGVLLQEGKLIAYFSEKMRLKLGVLHKVHKQVFKQLFSTIMPRLAETRVSPHNETI